MCLLLLASNFHRNLASLTADTSNGRKVCSLSHSYAHCSDTVASKSRFLISWTLLVSQRALVLGCPLLAKEHSASIRNKSSVAGRTSRFVSLACTSLGRSLCATQSFVPMEPFGVCMCGLRRSERSSPVVSLQRKVPLGCKGLLR